MSQVAGPSEILKRADTLRGEFGEGLADQVSQATYQQASRLAGDVLTQGGPDTTASWSTRLDRILTSRLWGFPIMVGLLWGTLWITITGANYPSGLLFDLTIGFGYEKLHAFAAFLHVPAWLSGLTIDGVYLAVAWVVSVMLPPMAIFFPLFTLLEDLGYLPRVAYNLDRLFKVCGAHGKQSLTMLMGFGCNAAGIVSTRIIDSPRERLIAIITNNFSVCNGRWPTLILFGTIFVGALAPAAVSSLVASATVAFVCLLGIAMTFVVSAFLSRTALKGEPSTFSLELPPYRPPRILPTIYRSIIDRTIFVLWRAILMAAPAGAIIWLTANIDIAGASIAAHLSSFLQPLGWFVGLNGIILLAYVIAIPANEIVVPSILMLTVTIALSGTGLSGLAEPGVMVEFEDNVVQQVLSAGGWTLLTAVNLLLFCLLHNPCSTTLLTIWKETRSLKWTVLSALIPLVLGFTACAVLTWTVRFIQSVIV